MDLVKQLIQVASRSCSGIDLGLVLLQQRLLLLLLAFVCEHNLPFGSLTADGCLKLSSFSRWLPGGSIRQA